MTTDVFASITASGESFSPSKWEALAKITCSTKREVGEIGTRGAYLGKPSPDGYGYYKLPATEANDDFFTGKAEFWNRLLNLVKAARDLQASNVELSATIFYKDQCNFWFSPEAITGIQSLGVPLSISCVEDKE